MDGLLKVNTRMSYSLPLEGLGEVEQRDIVNTWRSPTKQKRRWSAATLFSLVIQLSHVITDQLQRGLLTGDLVRWAEKSERAALKIVHVWACTNVSDFRNNWGEFGPESFRDSRSNANFAISECRVKFTWTLPSASKINKINFSSEAGAVLNFLLTFCFKTKSKSGCKGRKPLFLKKRMSIWLPDTIDSYFSDL